MPEQKKKKKKKKAVISLKTINSRILKLEQFIFVLLWLMMFTSGISCDKELDLKSAQYIYK